MSNNHSSAVEQLYQVVSLVQAKKFRQLDVDVLRKLNQFLGRSEPFLKAYLGDTFAALMNSLKNNKRIRLQKMAGVLKIRLDALKHWQQDGNETIRLISTGHIKPETIKPFIRFDQQAYDRYYQDQNASLKADLKNKQFKDNQDKTHVPIELTQNINHVFRKTYAVNVIETLIGVFKQFGIDQGQWLDVGCGVGYISNAVNPFLYGNDAWQIKGCDLQSSRIEFATKNAAAGRTYHSEDAFSVINEMARKGTKTHVVSMFEFCEHFTDPASLIQQACALPVDVVVLGTPLEQKLNKPANQEPDPVHLWGFSKESMQAIINTTPMQVLLTTETRLGDAGRGLNWLTVVAISKEMADKIEQVYGGGK